LHDLVSLRAWTQRDGPAPYGARGSTAYRIRTGVTAVRGRRPRPLDECGGRRAASLARRLRRSAADDRLDLDLDQELRTDEAAEPDHRRGRPHAREELAVRAPDVELVPLHVDDVHARAHDVRERRVERL